MGFKMTREEHAAWTLRENIEKYYRKYKVDIEITNYRILPGRVCYKVELKKDTTVEDLQKHCKNIQLRLQLPLFQVYIKNLAVYIVASDEMPEYDSLLEHLKTRRCQKIMAKMGLPYVTGHNIMGDTAITDLAEFPHLLLGGSTNSGKSVGLRAFITSTAYIKAPSEVNFILIDVGANSLRVFDRIPHLSCPIIRDHDTAYNALIALEAEMERRIGLEYDSPATFEQLPRLAVVIDEFPALFSGARDKQMEKRLTTAISNLLQRGRHGKINLILAAQNPTTRSMKVDLGNITGRIAFRCAKENYSETILGERGAENLLGQGCLLLRSPQTDGLQWMQGIYIEDDDILEIVQQLTSPQYQYDEGKKFHLDISTPPPAGTVGSLFSHMQPIAATSNPSVEDRVLASVIFWAFGKDHISTNMVIIEYQMGWKRATSIIKHLEKLGIVDEPNGKQPRRVLPSSIEDLSDELVGLMEYCDYPRDSLISRFSERAEAKKHPLSI